MSKTTKFKQPIVASELRFDKGSRAIGGNGELNASSVSDLLKQTAKLMEVASTQGVITEAAATESQKAAARRESIIAAFAGEEAHIQLGEVLADELYQAANREGFMRRFFARQELSQGQIPRVKMRLKNVVAVVAGSPSKVQTQIVRDNTLYPSEFYVTANPFVEKREIDQSTGDVLEEKYIEALESIMVAEDRLAYKMWQATVGVANYRTQVAGNLNPTTLAALRNQVARWNIPAANWLIANDVWNDIIGDSGFQQLIDPVSKHELLLTGQLGTILGMSIYSDGFRHPQHRVLSAGDMIVLGAQVNLGTYTDRGGIESEPQSQSVTGVPGKGWFLTESLSLVVGNARAVAVANRA